MAEPAPEEGVNELHAAVLSAHSLPSATYLRSPPGEMHDAVLHWRYLHCHTARYWPLPRALAQRWGWPPRLMLVVAAGRRWAPAR